MKKALVYLVILAVVLPMMVSASAEDIEFSCFLKYMPGITVINGTEYVIVTEKFTHYKSIYNTTGELIANFPFQNITYNNYGLFTAYNEDGLNNRALVSINGKQITEPKYGAFNVYSKNWVMAYVLVPATEEAYQYKRGKEFYNIESYELFYLSDEHNQTEPLAVFEADKLITAEIHGDYIAIMDSSETITLYDNTFKAYDFSMEKVSSPVYVIKDFTIVNSVTGELVLDGFTSVKEQKTNSGLWLLVTRTNFEGLGLSGIIDLQGQEIMPVEYLVNKVSSDQYVIVTNTDKLNGLYSIQKKKMIVPCEFNNIMVGKVSTDNYVHNGYVVVENGDLRGYYDIANQCVSCEVKYDRNTVTTIGCSTFWKVDEGVYMLAAADGVETEVHVDEISDKTRGNGYLLVAKKNGMYGLIDWHGKEILSFKHKWAITITDDSKAIIRTSTGLRIDQIIQK